MPETPRKLHGNAAKIDPKKHVESVFQTNPVTPSVKAPDGSPISPKGDIDTARSFQQENKK